MANAVRALESEYASVECTHDEFPRSAVSDTPFESSYVSSSSSEGPISSLPLTVFPEQNISRSPSPFAQPGSCQRLILR